MKIEVVGKASAKLEEKLRAWELEIEAAEKREKQAREYGEKTVELYEGDCDQGDVYNILWANVETLAPAMFSSTPIPVVQRRYKDQDPLGLAASKTIKRLLTYQLDSGETDEATFESLIHAAVLGALVPGRGVTRFRYEGSTTQAAAEKPEPNDDPESTDEPDDDRAEYPGELPEKIEREYVCGENVRYNRILYSSASEWKHVWWVAFEHDFTEAMAEKAFGKDVAELLGFEADKEGDDEAKGVKPTALVYEIWNKRERKVFWYSPDVKDRYLKKPEDPPVRISSFWPIPEPLVFINRLTKKPFIAPYKFYESQAKELNRISARIQRLIEMLKARGFYDANVADLVKLLEEGGDGTLLPTKNSAILAQGGTLDRAIWMVDLDPFIKALERLYAQRQEIRRVIFEIMGVADIMRGSSQASETLGAQKLKDQWGTLRMKVSQSRVVRYVVDCLRIMAEISINHLSQETIIKMTGLQFPRQADIEAMKAKVQMATMQGAQVNPEQLTALDKLPTWEAIFALFQDDVLRQYKVTIQSNSSVDLEATDEKEQMSAVMNALAQFMSGIKPLVEGGVLDVAVMKEMLLTIVRRFRFGEELEEQLMKVTEPKGDPKAEAAKQEQDAKMAQINAQVEAAKATADVAKQKAQFDLQIAQQEFELKKQEMLLKMEMMKETHRLGMEKLAAQALLPKAAPSAPAKNPKKG